MERDYVIEVRALTKRLGHKRALDGIDLWLEKGKCLALFGPNGAGKTKLIRVVSSLMRPTSGEVLAAGYDGKVKARIGGRNRWRTRLLIRRNPWGKIFGDRRSPLIQES